MALSLYKVGARGRVQLEGIAQTDDFYTVATGLDEDGAATITLTKVEVKTTYGKRATTGDVDE